MPAAHATRIGLDTEPDGRRSGRLGAWLIAAGFLVLGIGGGVVAWLRLNQEAGIEQVISALAIAVVGILGAIVHGAGVLAARRARHSQHELDRERSLARQALDRAAEIRAQSAGKIRDDLSVPGSIGGDPHGRSGSLGWQVEQVARNLEADAQLLEDLLLSHRRAEVAEAWRKLEAGSPETRRAMQRLIELSSCAKD
jgi:hypothetical protein